MAAKCFPFKSLKAMQAVATLLDGERSRQMSYYRLLKLLYIADRRHLGKTGRPILGGQAVAMDKGPLSSAVYDLIKRNHPDYPEWSQYFRVEGRNIEMLRHAGNGELSKREIDTLLDVFKEFEDRDDEELGAITHTFPEYQKHYHPNIAVPIPLVDIMEAVGCADQKDAVLQDAEEVGALDRVLGR